MPKLPSKEPFSPFGEYSPKESMRRARKFMATKGNLRPLKDNDFKSGNLLFLKYSAKDKTRIYDKNPLIMVLVHNSKHTLGLNFHWLPYNMRIELIRLIYSLNYSNVKNRKPLKFSYDDLRAFLKKRGYAPCIRKYINKGQNGVGFSKIGYKVPNSQLLGFARLNMMIFTGGLSTQQVYALAKNKKI